MKKFKRVLGILLLINIFIQVMTFLYWLGYDNTYLQTFKVISIVTYSVFCIIWLVIIIYVNLVDTE
jgi:hypothetical protein